jgi:hypothetical protein
VSKRGQQPLEQGTSTAPVLLSDWWPKRGQFCTLKGLPKLLHSIIVDVLIHKDNLERTRNGYVCRGPLHRLALAYAIRSRHALLAAALLSDDTPSEYWDWLAELIAEEGRDPNWRKRPSVLDTILGLTARPGAARERRSFRTAAHRRRRIEEPRTMPR